MGLVKLLKAFPKDKLGRYVVVGVWNTVFGYAVYAGLVWLLAGKVPLDYMVAAVLGNVLVVTQSFFAYKLLVFKTKGRVWAEYVKCWAVYGGVIGLGLLALPLFVWGCKLALPFAYEDFAPYIAGALMIGFTTVVSFLGHSNVTFKR